MRHSTLVGYARVSSDGQSLDLQREELLAAGCRHVFEEKRSGADADNREELQKALRFVADGDKLVVCKLDRLARSTIDMLSLVTGLAKRGVTFQSLAEPWASTDSPAAEMLLTFMAGVAQFERGRIRERQRAGIDRAKALGKYRGSKRRIRPEVVRALKAEGLGAVAIARKLGCGRASVYRALQAGTV